MTRQPLLGDKSVLPRVWVCPYICPGSDDEPCGIWMPDPGYCMAHPHVELVECDPSTLTGASRASYVDLHDEPGA